MFAIGKLLGSIVKNMNFPGELEAAIKTASGQMGVAGAMQKIAATSGGLLKMTNSTATQNTEKLLYIAALQGALEKANSSALFNMETQINDLWIRLDQLRANKPKVAQLADLLGKNNEFMNQLNSILQKQSQAIQSAVQTLK